MSSTASRRTGDQRGVQQGAGVRAASARRAGGLFGEARRAAARSAGSRESGFAARRHSRRAPSCSATPPRPPRNDAGAAAPGHGLARQGECYEAGGRRLDPGEAEQRRRDHAWASGSGAPWRPSTCHTATASSQPSPAPPIASGARASGRPSASASAQSASGHSPRSAARSTSGPALSASSRSTCSTRMPRRLPPSSVPHGQRSPSWRAMMPRRISRVPPRRRVGAGDHRDVGEHLLHLRRRADGIKQVAQASRAAPARSRCRRPSPAPPRAPACGRPGACRPTASDICRSVPARASRRPTVSGAAGSARRSSSAAASSGSEDR